MTGDASFGALGIGTSDTTTSIFIPQQLPRLWPRGICQVATGEAHSAALTLDGRVFTWGRGRAGALGLGDFQNSTTPGFVQALSGVKIKQITCGGDHTVAVVADSREVYAWGQGKWGATGLGHNDAVCTPQKVVGLDGEQRIVQASAGGRHTLLLTENNEVWAMGCNDNGQCGLPSSRSSVSNVSEIMRKRKNSDEEELIFQSKVGNAENRMDLEERKLPSESIQEQGGAFHLNRFESDSSPNEPSIILRPRKIAGMPPENSRGKIILYVVAGGDHNFAVVEQRNPVEVQSTEAKVAPMRAGPSWERPHGERWLPAAPEPILPLVRAALAEVAGSSIQGNTNNNGSRLDGVIKALKVSIDRTFGNPVFLIESFKLLEKSDSAAIAAWPERGRRLGVPTLDLGAISEMYQGILKLYDQGVVTVLGTASIRLLDCKSISLNVTSSKFEFVFFTRLSLNWFSYLKINAID